MTSASLQEALQNLPLKASEPIVGNQFIFPSFIKALGFEQNEIYSEYKTGDGPVDYAARKNIENDLFINTGNNPRLLVEIKGRDYCLQEGTAGYERTVKQLKRYLLAPNCESVEWGIITNSIHIQLFRKHGKVIHPATPCLEINLDNINKISEDIRQKIEKPVKALTVAVYNNKGGVGKTTTAVNLAAVLSRAAHKKVLLIDFDPNQQDLTNSLGLPLSEGKFLNVLKNRDDIRTSIQQYSIIHKGQEVKFFDIIPADKELVDIEEVKLRQFLKPDTLHEKLESVRSEYDYILIDSPPNWRVYSQLAIHAADVILIPAKHNNIFSLENAALAIKEFIPAAQTYRKDGGPIPLPIFFNGEKPTIPQVLIAKQAIREILKQARDEGFNLLPYFYPKYTSGSRNDDIFIVPNHANIASSAFSRIPAAYRDKTANHYYLALAKEYFLQ